MSEPCELSGLPEPEATLRAALVARVLMDANDLTEADGALQAAARLLAGVLQGAPEARLSGPARLLRDTVNEQMEGHGVTLRTAATFMQRDGASPHDAVQRASEAAGLTPGRVDAEGGPR